MNETRKDLVSASIWRLIWLHWRDILFSWDLLAAIVGAFVSLAIKPDSKTVIQLASAIVSVMSSIIGIVLAGLAVVTAFLDRNYVTVLDRVGHGVATEVFNFRYPAVAAIISVIFSVVLIVAQNETWYPGAYRWLMAITIFFFLYTLFIMLNLIASIGGHLMNRSAQLNSGNREHDPNEINKLEGQ